MNASTFLGLILCNLIWALHPIFSKILLISFSPHQAAWLRYSSALFSYLIWIQINKKFSKVSRPVAFLIPQNQRDTLLLVITGLMAFFISPLIQYSGLSHSLASENSIIVAMEPLITLLLAWVVLKERMNGIQLQAMILPLVGFGFLTGLSPSTLTEGFSVHRWGNLLILISLLGEATYSILGKKLSQTYLGSGIFGSSLLVGVSFNSAYLALFERENLFRFQSVDRSTLLALFFLGPIGTGAAYLYYMSTLAQTPILILSILLFIQPLAGAFVGSWYLKEQLNLSQLFGSGLIMTGVVLTILSFKNNKSQI